VKSAGIAVFDHKEPILNGDKLYLHVCSISFLKSFSLLLGQTSYVSYPYLRRVTSLECNILSFTLSQNFSWHLNTFKFWAGHFAPTFLESESPNYIGLLKSHLWICSQDSLEFAPVIVIRWDSGCKVFKMWTVING